MRYQLVCKEGPGWGLYRIAQGWATALGCGVAKLPDRTADVNVWIGYSYYGHYAQHHKPTAFDVVLFTHRIDKKKHTGWDRAARYANLCVCQSRRYAKFLPKAKTIILHPGFHPQFALGRRVRFLVIMATHKSKNGKPIPRKRTDWFEALDDSGVGEWLLTAGKYAYLALPLLIDWCDYVVIMSDMEGGPLVLHEALARHKPVIAPDVGYCWEWPVIRYTGFEELKAIVDALCRAADYRVEGAVPIGRKLKREIERRLK